MKTQADTVNEGITSKPIKYKDHLAVHLNQIKERASTLAWFNFDKRRMSLLLTRSSQKTISTINFTKYS